MSDDDAFLAAVRDRPDDATLRLVYADWLEERNDPRHELIRVEAAMRAVPVWSDEFQRLKPARSRLRAALPRDWLAAMDYLPKHRPMFGTLPPTFEQRWRLAEEFIDVWHGGLKPGDGYTEAEVAAAETRMRCRLPAALRDFYLRVGKRPSLFSNYERFIPLDDLWCGRHELVFREEVHSGCTYAISFETLAQDDPPVTLYGGMPTGHAVSETILLDLVTTTITNGPTYVLYDALDDDWIPTPRFKPTAIWGWWEAIDTMIGASGFAKCRTAEAYQHLVEDFGERVERLN